MRRGACLLLALALLPLAGCRRYAGVLPYAREIEHMELVRTLGVDVGADGVAVTASADGGAGEQARVAAAQGSSVSAAVLALQEMGDSYRYFGHVGQLLLGEALARQGMGPALGYVLRDVETRLETALYLVRGGEAGQAIRAAAQEGSADRRLEALAADVGLTADTMTRTVKDVLADLEDQGASFVPALDPGGELTAVGYGILKEENLAGGAEGDAALGVNLILSRVDADVVEVDLPEAPTAALRVVGASTRVLPVVEGGVLTGLTLRCKVDANLAQGPEDPDQVLLDRLEEALEEVEAERISAALALAEELDADYLGLRRRAVLNAPWYKEQLTRRQGVADLELAVRVEVTLQRSYHAGG